jgi:hypothetical protein
MLKKLRRNGLSIERVEGGFTISGKLTPCGALENAQASVSDRFYGVPLLEESTENRLTAKL